MSKAFRSGIRYTLAVLWVIVSAVIGQAWGAGEEKASYRATVLFVEGCNCSIPCSCEMGEMKHGCQDVGVLAFTAGSYKGVSLAGAKLAYATSLGNWVRLYMQANDAKQQEAVTDFARRSMADFGKIEDVKAAKVEIAGTDGKYTLTVDGGKIMRLEEPGLAGAAFAMTREVSRSEATTKPMSPTTGSLIIALLPPCILLTCIP